MPVTWHVLCCEQSFGTLARGLREERIPCVLPRPRGTALPHRPRARAQSPGAGRAASRHWTHRSGRCDAGRRRSGCASGAPGPELQRGLENMRALLDAPRPSRKKQPGPLSSTSRVPSTARATGGAGGRPIFRRPTASSCSRSTASSTLTGTSTKTPFGSTIPTSAGSRFSMRSRSAICVSARRRVQGLRSYLLAGGFLVIDDFWGTWEWSTFEQQIRQVLPEYPIVEMPLDHPIFNSVYRIEEIIQVPAITTTGTVGPGSRTASFLTPAGSLMTRAG